MKLILLLILQITCLLNALSQQNNSSSKLVTIEFDKLLNKSFATLELEDHLGNTFNTASLKGKTLYVDFWFTQCAPCLAEIAYSKVLKSFFESDTNIVFLNICIDYKEQKDHWKKLIAEKEIGGIHLFYAKNQPQKINLLREYKVLQFPTYMLVNTDFKIIGYNGPAPSEKNWVQWAIHQATKNVKLSSAFISYKKGTEEAREFHFKNNLLIQSLYSGLKN